MDAADHTRRELARLADELLEQAEALRKQYETLADMLGAEDSGDTDESDDRLERKAG